MCETRLLQVPSTSTSRLVRYFYFFPQFFFRFKLHFLLLFFHTCSSHSQTGLLFYKLVPVQNWCRQIPARDHRSLPVHPPGLRLRCRRQWPRGRPAGRDQRDSAVRIIPEAEGQVRRTALVGLLSSLQSLGPQFCTHTHIWTHTSPNQTSRGLFDLLGLRFFVW